VPLCLVPEVLNAIDMIVSVFSKIIGVIDAKMPEFRDVEGGVGVVGICIND
jgi:hypothetical protein